MKRLVTVVIAALLMLGLVGLALANISKDENNGSPDGSFIANQQKTGADEQTSGSQSSAAVITYSDDNGFNPQTLTVKLGEKVTIKNGSSRTIQFDSDPHPAHTDNTELNVDVIRPGQSQSFTVNRKGTFGYHDHLDPNSTGTIIVN